MWDVMNEKGLVKRPASIVTCLVYQYTDRGMKTAPRQFVERLEEVRHVIGQHVAQRLGDVGWSLRHWISQSVGG